MVKVGFIGAGGIARAHAKAISHIEEAKLVAFADVDLSRAEELARTYGAKGFTDYRDVLAMDTDVIFVCTPPFLHKEHAIAAAQAGKDVFCEKPITASLEEARELMVGVESTGARITFGYVFHFWPVRAWFRKVFESGQLGDLVTVWSTRIVSTGWRRGDWLEIPEQSGALTGEFYGHDLEWMCGIGGDPETAYGRMLTVHPKLKSEDNVQCILTFEQGLGVGGASWSKTNPSIDRFGIIGTKGSISMEGGGLIQFKPSSGQEQTLHADVPTGHIGAALLPDSPRIPVQDRFVWAMELEDRDFFKCLSTGKAPAVSCADAYRALEVALAIRKSAEEGKVIKL